MSDPRQPTPWSTWVWLLAVSTVLAVVMLFVNHAGTGDWVAAVRHALVIFATAGVIGAARIGRRQFPR